MTFLLRRWLFVAAIVLAPAANLQADAPAFPFTYFIHDTTGVQADTPISSIYQFPATPLGSSSHLVIKAINTSNSAAFMGQVLVTSASNSTVANTNFTITALASSVSVPTGGSLIFTINFSPTVTGPATGYMQTSYQVQTPGCAFTSTNTSTQCPSGLNASATLTALATDPQLVLSYQSATGSTTLQPSANGLNFGNVSTSGTAPITFTLSNLSPVSINVPAITVPAPTAYSANPFLLDISGMPVSLAAGTSANFTVTFEPGQTGLATTNLIVGNNSYPILGEGVVVADIDALQISYVDSTGVRGLPQVATPINFGQLVAGASGSNVLTFTVTNPATSYNSVPVSSITVSGTGFNLSAITGATSFPANLDPGESIGFKITFASVASGSYAGRLTIGARSFSLAGLSINSPLPSFSLVVNPSPLTSQQQATVSIQLSGVSALNLTGTISLAFTPGLTGVTDDPAIMFLATSGRQLPVSIAAGAQAAAYNGQSALSFQTGTTAGTITFTVTFPNTPAFTQSYSITPAIVQITSATALRSNPNLVITLAGFDNSYSAGRLNFTFYDTAGAVIAPVAVDASGSFQQLFFTNNQAGGAFSLQAAFPVTGDVNRVGSVAVTMNNSVGQANITKVF